MKAAAHSIKSRCLHDACGEMWHNTAKIQVCKIIVGKNISSAFILVFKKKKKSVQNS